MPDRDFDKSIQRKANELRLQPSPEVWERVAAQLNEKDRKRGFAWIWLAAAMLAGGLSLWFFGPALLNESPKTGQQAQHTTNKEHTKTSKQNSSPLNSSASNNPSTTSGNNDLNSTSGSLSSSASSSNSASSVDKSTQQNASDKTVSETIAFNASAKKKSKSRTAARPYAKTETELFVSKEPDFSVAANNELIDENRLSGKRIAFQLEKPASGSVEDNGAKEGDTKLSADLLASIPEKPSKKQDNWNLAFQMGGGSGSMREGLSNSYAPRYESMAGNALLGPSVAAPLDPRPSDVKAGPSFQASIGISRPIGKKTSFITGLQYAYFSNRIEVGRKIDSSAVNSNFRLQSISGTAAYTGAGNEGKAYYNAYHYLQIPLEIGLALDAKNRLSWNNGIVLGYLISTDALHYNETAGAYYKDNELVNKFQTSAQTSLQYRLFPGSSWNLSIGPYLNYQLRNIDKTEGSKRLFTVGLNARLLLGTSK
jgi:hypothetical protein